MPSKSLYWHTFGSLREALRQAGYDLPIGEERLERAIELWPRLLARRSHVAALHGFLPTAGHEHHTTLHTARKLLAAWSEQVGLDIAGQAGRFAKRG